MFVLRRLRCSSCLKLHHELPDCLVPHKHYESECVESALTCTLAISIVPAEASTIRRWKLWFFSSVVYWLGCLEAIALRLGNPVTVQSAPSQSAHQRIGHVVGHAEGWLARVVRPITNAHLWVHTRFAYVSKPLLGRLEKVY